MAYSVAKLKRILQCCWSFS